MIIKDDRTEEQKKTHIYLVVGSDNLFACYGKSYVAWACTSKEIDRVEQWVRSRRDIKRVRIVVGDYRPRGKGYCHIYVAKRHHRVWLWKNTN